MNPLKDQQELTFAEFSRKADYARRLVEWGMGMFRAEYNDVVSLFGGFEFLVYGFIDDRVRSSLLLPLGNIAARLWDIASGLSGTSNQVMNIRTQNQVRGLNPGFALGEFEVIAGMRKDMDWNSKKIYVLEHAPADIKPVAGIMAVSEGNLVSHVQLLARNLGQLKFLLPDQMVEGLVIPFAVFQEHLDQKMPGRDLTYWEFLHQTFKTAAQERLQGKSEEEVEDLKDFTGAGLNLTVFNVLETDKIFQGIRDVWASPYSERSYLWRQKYLENPENVFPSILLLLSVNVDKSGLMITTGVTTSSSEDITIAFSRGVGGAVEGQAAETYIMSAEQENLLLSPAREMRYTVLPITGGKGKAYSRLNRRLLSTAYLHQLRLLAGQRPSNSVCPGRRVSRAVDLLISNWGSKIPNPGCSRCGLM